MRWWWEERVEETTVDKRCQHIRETKGKWRSLQMRANKILPANKEGDTCEKSSNPRNLGKGKTLVVPDQSDQVPVSDAHSEGHQLTNSV